MKAYNRDRKPIEIDLNQFQVCGNPHMFIPDELPIRRVRVQEYIDLKDLSHRVLVPTTAPTDINLWKDID